MGHCLPTRTRNGVRSRIRSSDRCTIYSGTRPQLEALGLVPARITWPDDAEAIAWGRAPVYWLALAHAPTQQFTLYVCPQSATSEA